MTLSSGPTPTDSAGARAGATGWAPGAGVLPVQLGTPVADNTAGASGQKSAPMITQTTITGTATGSASASIMAAGELRVALEPSQLFQDGFDTATLDITNKWLAPVAAGGGVAASNTLTNTQLGTGTTISGYSYLESAVSFPPANPGWLLFYTGVNIVWPIVANQYFFWGMGTSPGSPTAAAPLTNACGFEVGVTGKMMCVTYQSGTRVAVQDLSAATGSGKQPQDSSVHKYFIYYKGDNIYWCIDGIDNVVGSTLTGAPGPDVNILPIKFTAIAGAVAPVSSGVLTVNTVNLADTGGNNIQISDGTYPWRQATVDAGGNLQVKVSGGNDLVLIPSAAFTTTQTTVDQINTSGRGVRVVLDMTVVGTGSVTLEIDAKDVASGKYVAQLTGAAVITNSTNVYVVYPGLTAAANSVASDVLSHTWRVKVVANNANSCTYSVGASMLT